MQKVLRKRVFRDLKKHFIRYSMLGIMIALGIFLVVTIVGSGETLSRGTVNLAEQTNLEDGEFEVFVPLKESEVRHIEKMGFDLAEQFYFDYDMENEDEGTVRIFKIRDKINQIYYVSGCEPADNDEIVIEKRYACEHGLTVGDEFKIAGKFYKIAGIGVTSDYDGPFKEISDTSCNSSLFGLVFMKDGAYEEFKSSGNAQKAEEYSYAYKLGKGNNDDDLKDELDSSKANVINFITREDNPRIFATKNDKLVDIVSGMFAGALIFILFAYVISVYVVHTIEKESSVIGTLYSMGVKKNSLLLHYITLPFFVTLVSGTLGALVASTGTMATMIAESSYLYFSIPEFEFSVPDYLGVYSILCPPLMAIIVNMLVINSKLNRTSLSLIRNEVKQRNIKKINLKHFDFIRAFRIRQMLWELRSTLGVVMGMFLSLLILMIAVNCFTLCRNITIDYENDTKYEYMYTLKYPENVVPKDAEKAYAYACKMNHLGYNFDVTLLGIDDNNKYFEVTPGKSRMEVVISSALAEKFQLKEGDEFIVTDNNKKMKYAFSVRKITNYSAGFFVFLDIDELRNMMEKEPEYYNVLFSDEELDIEPESIYSINIKDDIVRGTTVFTDLMKPMIYTLSTVSAIIFAVVMYLMMKVMIDRSGQSISMIKVFGYRSKEIKRLYLDGNFYVIVAGALIVIPLSKKIMNMLYPFMISNVSCGMNLSTPTYIYFIIFAGVLVLYFIINTALVKQLDKYTPAVIIKNRE